MNHRDARELIAAYALGALEARELLRLEEHLSACAFCANLAREAREVTAWLAFAARYREPPADGLARLQTRLEREELPSPLLSPEPGSAGLVSSSHSSAGEHDGVTLETRRPGKIGWRRWISPLPVAASLLLALGLGFWNWSLLGEVRDERREMDALNSRLTQQSELLFVATSHGMETRPLQSTSLAPNARVRLILDPDSNSAMVMASRLPQLPAGRIYQVWLGRGANRIPAATLIVDKQGDGEARLYAFDEIVSYDSAWITVESEQDGPSPNSPGVARGSL